MSISRREFIKLAGAGVAAGSLATFEPFPWLADAAVLPLTMAMHIHSSFSEGSGSMSWQLDQAQRNGVDVVWWTDHDFRMQAWKHRQAIHCNGSPETEDGARKITWGRSTSGTLQSSTASFVTSPVSPLDPDTTHSMRLAAKAATTSFSAVRFTMADGNSRHCTRTNLTGQSIIVEVRPESIGPNAYLEIKFRISDQPASGARAAGQYTVSYRVGGPLPAGQRQATNRDGVVSLAAPTGTWTTLVLTPTTDIAALWPDLVAQDNGLYQLSAAAASRNGAQAAGNIDYIRFQRTTSGSIPLGVQKQIWTSLAGRYPDVTQRQGLEVSLYPRHINWFGGNVVLPDQGSASLSPTDSTAVTHAQIAMIHAAGGLASYNHMYGTSFTVNPVAVATQEAARIKVTKELITNKAFEADILEVGYRVREGVTLDRHLTAWDVCSRNALFLTGNGVSDSHNGTWAGSHFTFVTGAWAADTSESALCGALAAGQAWFHDFELFSGTVNLDVDGSCPMGSVSVSSAATRTLNVGATGVPSGGSVVVVHGPVDSPGPSITEPNVTRQTIPASAFAGGPVSVTLDTSAASFARAEVYNGGGLMVAGSNPVWMLRKTPAGGIPAPRQA